MLSINKYKQNMACPNRLNQMHPWSFKFLHLENDHVDNLFCMESKLFTISFAIGKTYSKYILLKVFDFYTSPWVKVAFNIWCGSYYWY